MATSGPTLEAIRYTRGSLSILDQLQLPHTTKFDAIRTTEDAHDAIKKMRVRGAPAIAIVALLAVAVELEATKPLGSAAAVVEWFFGRLDYIITSRPTAVNLAEACQRAKSTVSQFVAAGIDAALSESAKETLVRDAIESFAHKMLEHDVADNKSIGSFGSKWVVSQTQESESGSSRKVKVLTHCNTGSLATAGYGTALGIIRSLHLGGHLEHAFCTETRPYNQGSRLTAYELVYEKIPATLVCDNMVASLMRSQKIDVVVVGADRVTVNGDTANKIGTYQLALLAKAHGVKFVVAAPWTSIDLNLASGDLIPIEQRPSTEVTHTRGSIDGTSDSATVHVAADGINVWNPGFDVTPGELIDAIVTEKGVVVRGPQGYNLTEAKAKLL